MRNQKGITLIALVITIIVLLILAGVSIAMLTGSNGVLTKATTAKSETAVAEIKEQVTLAMNEILMNANDPTNTTADSTTYPKTLTLTNIVAKINANVGADTATAGTDGTDGVSITYKYGSDTYTVELAGTSTAITKIVDVTKD